MALPVKEWLSLSELANRWSCNESDIFYFGLVHGLRLSFDWRLVFDIKSKDLNGEATCYVNFVWLKEGLMPLFDTLHQSSEEELKERIKSVYDFTYVPDFSRINKNPDLRLAHLHFSDIEELQRSDDGAAIRWSFVGKQPKGKEKLMLLVSDKKEINPEVWARAPEGLPLKAWPKIRRENLIVGVGEVERFEQLHRIGSYEGKHTRANHLSDRLESTYLKTVYGLLHLLKQKRLQPYSQALVINELESMNGELGLPKKSTLEKIFAKANESVGKSEN